METNQIQNKANDLPKKPLSRFFIYQVQRREILRQEQPELTPMEVVKKMSDEWNNMSESEKSKYQELAEKEKNRYEKEMKEYDEKQVLDDEDKVDSAENESTEENAKKEVKQTQSAFYFYQMERKEIIKQEQPELTPKDVISKMSGEWNYMCEAERSKYRKLADEDKERYEREKREYDEKKQLNMEDEVKPAENK
jgi:hypothetical protein